MHYNLPLLRSLPIEQVAERLGLHVHRHKALCPYHHDTAPSLSFSISRNIFHCFVCGAHGGPIDLVMKVANKSFVDACRWLSDENNILPEADTRKPQSKPALPPDLPYLESLISVPVLNAEASEFLFKQRHYDPRVIKWLGISSISHPTPCRHDGRPFYDAPSLLFPYRDVNGRLLNVQSRYLGSTDGKRRVPRFRFPSHSNARIFNLPILNYLIPDEPLYLSEGITDCIALLSSGHKAIAIPSASLLGPSEAIILNDLHQRLRTPFHIFPDQDSAGQHLYEQLRTLSQHYGFPLIRHHLPPTCKDFSDLYTLTVTSSLQQDL